STIIAVHAMDWSATHCRPTAQQRAKIVTARAMQRSTLARVEIYCPRVNPPSRTRTRVEWYKRRTNARAEWYKSRRMTTLVLISDDEDYATPSALPCVFPQTRLVMDRFSL